jgi:hypothetical protein
MNVTLKWPSLAMTGALVAGSASAALLVNDVPTNGLTIAHAMSLALLTSAVLSGKVGASLFRKGWRQWPLGLVLCTLSLLATVFVVFENGGRRAETHDAKAQFAGRVEMDRAKWLANEKSWRDGALDAERHANKWCVKSGRTAEAKCEEHKANALTLTGYADDAASKARGADIVPVDAKAKNVAWLLAFTGIQPDRKKAEEAIPMLDPFLVPALLEVLTIAFSFAWGAFRVTPAPAPVKKPEPVDEGEKPGTALVPTKPNLRVLHSAPEDDLAALRAFFHVGEGPVTNKELAERMGVTEGAASKRVAKLAAAGHVTKAKTGRKAAIHLN